MAVGDIGMEKAGTDPLETSTMRSVNRRILPLLMLCFFSAMLDRTNVGFAALTMNQNLGFSSSVFGFGAGLFFVGYFFFELPSNFVLMRVGARRWIARISLSWGFVSGLTAFIWDESSFYAVRVLLGIAEAGLAPGALYLFTLWYPSVYQARAFALFFAAAVANNIAGPLFGGAIMQLDGIARLAGWQWLFLIEAMPSIALGFAVLRWLPDGPAAAGWLSPDQKSWLARRLDAERLHREEVRHYHQFRDLWRSGRFLGLVVVYFGLVVAAYGSSLFMPQIVKSFGISVAQTALVTPIPYVFALAFMLFWGWRSDQTGARTFHVVTSLLLATAGLSMCVLTHDPILMMLALVLAQMGIASSVATFWTIPTAMLSGTAAAGGIALINSLGNLGGFLGPWLVGFVKDATGSYNLGLLTVSSGTLIGALLLLAIGHDRRLDRA